MSWELEKPHLNFRLQQRTAAAPQQSLPATLFLLSENATYSCLLSTVIQATKNIWVSQKNEDVGYNWLCKQLSDLNTMFCQVYILNWSFMNWFCLPGFFASEVTKEKTVLREWRQAEWRQMCSRWTYFSLKSSAASLALSISKMTRELSMVAARIWQLRNREGFLWITVKYLIHSPWANQRSVILCTTWIRTITGKYVCTTSDLTCSQENYLSSLWGLSHSLLFNYWINVLITLNTFC